MTIRLGRLSGFAFVFLASCALLCGCVRTAEETEGEKQSSDAAVVKESGSGKEAPQKDAAPKQEHGFDASRILGEATSEFAKTFSDEDQEETADKTGSIDISLVDEETRKKYTEDRTLITPTLDVQADSNAQKYKLEYLFKPDSNLSWNVVHRVRKRISYGGKESLIETSSTTFRRWEFLEAKPDGKIAARHWIDRMILQQNEEGKDQIDYDSERDVVVPKEISAFGTEKAVGVALETFDVNPLGVLSDKTKLVAEYQGREGDSNVVVPFPKEEVAVGDVWTIPYALHLKGTDKVTRPYHVVERFRLEKIDEKYATISFKTTLVSIVDDPVVEGELAERLFTGRALFDRELGLNVRTEMTFDRKVTGAFGFSSFLEYNCQVTEKLINSEEQAQSR